MNNIFYVNHLGQIPLFELESLFSLVGDVKSIREEALLNSNVGTRFGVIEMENERQALDCVERFHGDETLGQRLSLSTTMPVLAKVIPGIAKAAKRRGGKK